MQRTDANKLYRKLDGNKCLYCGEPAAVGDHAWPMAATCKNYMPLSVEMLIIVPACIECNYLASDHVFESLRQKQRFIRERIRQKYALQLSVDKWTDEELETYDCPNLLSAINSQRGMLWRLQRRLKWPLVKNAEIASRLDVSGNASAPSSAEINGISENRIKLCKHGERRTGFDALLLTISQMR